MNIVMALLKQKHHLINITLVILLAILLVKVQQVIIQLLFQLFGINSLKIHQNNIALLSTNKTNQCLLP